MGIFSRSGIINEAAVASTNKGDLKRTGSTWARMSSINKSGQRSARQRKERHHFNTYGLKKLCLNENVLWSVVFAPTNKASSSKTLN